MASCSPRQNDGETKHIVSTGFQFRRRRFLRRLHDAMDDEEEEHKYDEDHHASIEHEIQAMMAETQHLLSNVNQFLDGQHEKEEQWRIRPLENQLHVEHDDTKRPQSDNQHPNQHDTEEQVPIDSNRAINASKVAELQALMLPGLLRLGFQDSVCMDALNASAQEIDHFDDDCELAFADIFMSMVKMVSDAHVGFESSASFRPSNDHQEDEAFPWPVFDMAQFEFGSARAATRFDAVVVITNLPKVALDRTEELMEILSVHVFAMVGEPIQVVIPSVSSTGRTKGHAFVEFEDPALARVASEAISGLVWNARSPVGVIQARLFREYQVVSSPHLPVEQHAEDQDQEASVGSEDEASEYFESSFDDDEEEVEEGSRPETQEADRWMPRHRSPLFRHRGLRVASTSATQDPDVMLRLEDLSLCSDDDQELQEEAEAAEAPPYHHYEEPAQGFVQEPEAVITPLRWSHHIEEKHVDAESVNRPWRAYSEELIARNHHLQQQLSFLRRRIVQLGHHNHKLHLLVDRLERDRDGLLFENDLLQAQMTGFEDHERRHEMLLQDLLVLQKRLDKKERKCAQQKRLLERSIPSSGDLETVQMQLEQHWSPSALAMRSFDDLKAQETMLETSLNHIRAAKEAKALEMQAQIHRQHEAQLETKLCVICLSSEKTILCLPCRHLCLCETCSQRQEVEKCPICRLEIQEMLFVYA